MDRGLRISMPYLQLLVSFFRQTSLSELCKVALPILKAQGHPRRSLQKPHGCRVDRWLERGVCA